MQAVMTLRLRTTLWDCLASLTEFADEWGSLTASIGLVRRRILGGKLSREGGKGKGMGLAYACGLGGQSLC